MKRVIALTLSVILLATLAACGVSHETPSLEATETTSNAISDQPSQTADPVTSLSEEPVQAEIALVDLNMKMLIDLEIKDDQIFVSASINAKSENNEFSFQFGRDLILDEVSNASGSLEWQKENTTIFYSDAQKVTVTIDTDDIITVKYHGYMNTDNPMSFIKPHAISILHNSLWYPQDFLFPSDISDQICAKVHGLTDYLVLHAEYNDQDGVWTYYSPKNPSFKDNYRIIALKKDSFVTALNDDVYCVDEAELDMAVVLYNYLTDVYKYYNDVLYPDYRKDEVDLKVVSYSTGEGNMTYDDGLMVLNSMYGEGNDLLNWMKSGYAHEWGHLWAHGADMTWEDWLNETCAEWSSLLYLLYSGQQDVFDATMNETLERAANEPAIKTPDGSWPGSAAVHTKGTVLFYSIYQEYGAESIQKLLNAFVSLEEKNTENFIHEVSRTIGDDVANIIREGILK